MVWRGLCVGVRRNQRGVVWMGEVLASVGRRRRVFWCPQVLCVVACALVMWAGSWVCIPRGWGERLGVPRGDDVGGGVAAYVCGVLAGGPVGGQVGLQAGWVVR